MEAYSHAVLIFICITKLPKRLQQIKDSIARPSFCHVLYVGLGTNKTLTNSVILNSKKKLLYLKSFASYLNEIRITSSSRGFTVRSVMKEESRVYGRGANGLGAYRAGRPPIIIRHQLVVR